MDSDPEEASYKSILIQIFSHGLQRILTTVNPWAQRIPTKALIEHKSFILRPYMDTRLTYQTPFRGFAKGRAAIQDRAAVS